MHSLKVLRHGSHSSVKSFIRLTQKLYKNYSNTTKLTSRIRQSWQAHKGGHVDQEDRQHESRRGELPIEPRTGSFYILTTDTGS